MLTFIQRARFAGIWKPEITRYHLVFVASLCIQLVLAAFLGHHYDMRIFMATGYLVGSGQNPYIAQDLTTVFNNNSFQGMTSVGYLPPWPIYLGFIYQGIYRIIPSIFLYNLLIKLPIIAANILLAFLVADILKKLDVEQEIRWKAWVFLLLNPFLLYFATAWGQFDSIVALFSLLALVLLYSEKPRISAVLLALAIALKPIALPILPVSLVFLAGKSLRQALTYVLVFFISVLLFSVAPFFIFGWDLSPILQGWNAHFTVGGGMSFLSFFELLEDTYQLPGLWWLLGLIWIPALLIGVLTFRDGIDGFVDLLVKSTGLVMLFFLTRTWLSEPNVILILPLILILTLVGKFNSLAFIAVWTLPLIFTIFNTSPPQLLFPTFPGVMDDLLILSDEIRTVRLVARTIVVIPWLVTGWWIVYLCLKRDSARVD